MFLKPADRFTIEDLSEVYNQTREDYIVPMPMSPARLRDYIELYDVDLKRSWVAVQDEKLLGLGMLGVRQDRAWITRLGVLAGGRRQGVGRAITDRLLQSAASLSLNTVWLEVIRGNVPAYKMFRAAGFNDSRELIVARRPPELYPRQDQYPRWLEEVDEIRILDRVEALEFASNRSNRPNWLNEAESLANIQDLKAISVKMNDGGLGWVCYRIYMYHLANIVVGVSCGKFPLVGEAVLRALHREHPKLDAVIENISNTDQIWSILQKMGYFEAFRRVEMVFYGAGQGQ